MRPEFGYFEEKKLGKPYDVKLIRRLYPFSRPYKLLLIISISLMCFITLLELSVPYVTKIAIDQYIVPQYDSAAKRQFKDGSPGSSKEKTRFYRARLTDEDIRKAVFKHKDLFEIQEGIAIIAFEDLSKLDRHDLSVIRKYDHAGIGFASGILLGLVLLTLGLSFIQVMLMEYTGQQIMHDLRIKLFEHIQSLSVAFFSRNPVGRLVTRVTNDIQNMHELFTSVVMVIFKDFFLLGGIAFVLLGINWKLALVSFAVIPFVLFASFKFSNLARDAFRVLRIKIAEINTHFSETVGGIEVVQLFRQERHNYRTFEKLNHENYLAGMQQIQIFAVFMPVIELLGSISIAVVIFYGGRGVVEDYISLGALVAFISYMKMFFRPIRDIAEKYNIMQNAMASAERIFLLFDTEDKLPQPASTQVHQTGPETVLPVQGKISEIGIENVSFGYLKDEIVLKDISFTVRSGESIALVGPTGSGKTTLINLIIRFYDPLSGRVIINGRDLKDVDVSELRSKMALVTQEPFLFSESIRNNIVQQNENISGAKLDDIINASNCKNLIDKLPDGLDTVLSEGGTSISSGERQLISIARAFARDPELIILDEATSYIDTQTEQKIQEALFNLMKNRTSIIVAHRLSTARAADLIFVLNRGQIIENGTHEALMQRKGFYFKLNQLQNDRTPFQE
ncbi:ABC transporter ATP-binding protein [Thermodesulfobacteriota bacterium]